MGLEGVDPDTSEIQIARDKFEETTMKKLIIAVAAIAILSGPVYAKPSMHNQMVKMMQMMKEMKARNIQLERILQNMMDNLSTSHHG
jgi:predicted house-cleaning NTP pyrophosphatase (Maf/HAM1 superfamily)